ncbi:hypothetical protein K8B83_12715 [Shewanella inventionis]|uniref:Lipoprotein n=1 Tax=Shewanella inventionis TaxID=1738770 RepID=A0ABQ1JKJ6_9GAMM|nr:hypothetical protein [Shewanella inventionis]MCL1158411.1 hypothetical protein [Shewanella inventionis]UAL41764.1 hypothetical protein K8B83_12715 [Shewanella inventionis]GGB68595.1 hypothetical protein GCM10011607_31520 [Shewanella inventionis]
MHKITKIFILVISSIFLIACDNTKNSQQTTFEKDPSLCQFSAGQCYQKVADLTVGLMIDPVRTPSEKPLNITLNFSQAITNIAMRVEGRDMFMGIIPVALSSTANNQAQGTLIYGSCSSNYMVWRAFVSFDYQGQTRTLTYDFLADSPE